MTSEAIQKNMGLDSALEPIAPARFVDDVDYPTQKERFYSEPAVFLDHIGDAIADHKDPVFLTLMAMLNAAQNASKDAVKEIHHRDIGKFIAEKIEEYAEDLDKE